MMMTLIRLPDSKQEYVNDLDDLIDISSEYISDDFSRLLENEIKNQIEDTKEEIHDLEAIKDDLQSDKDELDNLIMSIRTRLEKINDNIDKISMEDVQDIVDDILTDI